MRLKDNTNPFIHVNPPYQLMVIHSSKLVYPRELYQRGVKRKRVELIAAHLNEYVSQMQALGVDIQTIQSIVGHADTEMTEHYLHVQESIRQSSIQLFSEAFSA